LIFQNNCNLQLHSNIFLIYKGILLKAILRAICG
jgi:hypothetical protein